VDPGDGLPWIGVLDGDFGHDSGYEGVSVGDRTRIAEVCVAHYPAALRAIAEAWPRLGEPAIGIARAWAVRLLACVAAETGGAPLALAERGIASIGMISLFVDITGNERTLDELHVDWRDHEDLVYARQPGPQLERLVLAIEDDEDIGALTTIFGTVRDWSLELARRAEVEARRRSSPVMPTVPDDALVSVEFEGRGLLGWLWLEPDVHDESEVSFGRDGRVVGGYRVSSMFPCLGAVTGQGLEIDDDWTGFELSTAQQNQLKNEACTLYEQLLAKAKGQSAIDERSARPLRNLLLRLHAIPTARRKWPNHDQRKMYRELRQLPLLPLTTGKAISLAVALRERPASLERLGLWDPRERAVDDVPHVEPVKEPRPVTSTPPAAKPPAPIAAPPPVDPAPAVAGPPPAPRRPSPFEPVLRVLAAVRAELRFVRAAEPTLLANIHLERMTVHELTGDAVVHWIDGLLVVDASHAVVKRALAEPERPLFASMIASAVYTTLNCALQEVTDAQELVFLRWHAAHVRTAARDRSGV